MTETRKIAIEFARRNRNNSTWRAFKKKWDGKTPRKNSVRFAEFVSDAEKAQASVNAILQQIQDEI